MRLTSLLAGYSWVVYTHIDSEQVLAGIQGHDDFFNGGIACALADSVYATFHLIGTSFDCGEAIGY